jgi:hypothetical protein
MRSARSRVLLSVGLVALPVVCSPAGEWLCRVVGALDGAGELDP